MKLTRKQAMDAFCKLCIYDEGAQGAGSWRKQVSECTSQDCPLYEYRPLDSESAEIAKKERYAAMTPSERADWDARADAARINLAKNM